MTSKNSLLPIIKRLPRLEQLVIEQKYQMQDGFNFYKAIVHDATDEFFGWIDYRMSHEKGANAIIQFYGIGGTGKSYSMIYVAKKIEPTFSLDRIFFQLGDVSMAQESIKRRQAICIDERMPSFGIGSTRLMNEFNHIIETAREPQNAILVSSITPYMSELSHWMLETMFIHDNHVYFALRDPKKIVYGYVKVPHPDTIYPKAFLEGYMEKKKRFNAQLRHMEQYDHISDMGKQILNSKPFKMMEEQYENKKSKKGIPTQMLVEIIADAHPELRRNVEAKQLAVWIRANRIKSGVWKP